MRLDDRYRALKPIGQGGFGRTFLAVDEWAGDFPLAQAEQPDPTEATAGKSSGDASSQSSAFPSSPYCVIKQLLPRHGTDSQRAIELFRQEAERLAELGQHPQIPQLLAHFEDETAQYLVQEYIAGQNLEQILQQEGTWSERQIRDLLADLLPVLQYIHDRQVIHRDIKPENIIRTQQGDRLVLVDFGAAKYASAMALAQTGTMIGSAGYVAPEQIMGKGQFSSDLYSLGVTCIHLLTGLHPFDLYSVSEDAWIWHQYLSRPVSGRLRRIVNQLLQKATRQRYQTATAVMQDLGVEIGESKPRQTAAVGRSSAADHPTARKTLSWRNVLTLTGHEGSITAIAISPGGRILASGSNDKAIKFWSLATGELLHTFPGRSLWLRDGHGDRISNLVFSPNGETLVSASADGAVKWWDLTSRQTIDTVPSHGWGMATVAFHPKGHWLACGSSDGLIQIWHLKTGELASQLKQHTAPVSGLLFTANGRTLISCSHDRSIRLWDWAKEVATKTLMGHLDRVSAIALSPDQRTLISGSWDKTLKLWDLEFGEQRKVIAAHRKPITSLAVHPQQGWFASGSEDCTIKLWHLETGTRLGSLKSFWGVNALAVTPDGKTLVSGSADELIKLWRRERRQQEKGDRR